MPGSRLRGVDRRTVWLCCVCHPGHSACPCRSTASSRAGQLALCGVASISRPRPVQRLTVRSRRTATPPLNSSVRHHNRHVRALAKAPTKKQCRVRRGRMKVSSSSRLSQCHLRARLSPTPLKHVHLQRVFSPTVEVVENGWVGKPGAPPVAGGA
jgi:hypothetical protein